MFRGSGAIIDLLLSKLEGVSKRGQNQWLARCPSHDDNSPSLSVKEDEGAVLIHCFAGCPPSEVLHAVGMEFSDLYPEKLEIRKGKKPYWNSRDLLLVIRDEAIVVAIAGASIVKGEALDRRDLDRVQLASQRIWKALGVANVR